MFKYLIFILIFLISSCNQTSSVKKKYYGIIAHGAGEIKCELLDNQNTLRQCTGWAGDTIYNAANIYTFEQ